MANGLLSICIGLSKFAHRLPFMRDDPGHVPSFDLVAGGVCLTYDPGGNPFTARSAHEFFSLQTEINDCARSGNETAPNTR
jgi:hypothetical protein